MGERREYPTREIFRHGRYAQCQVMTKWTSTGDCPEFIACNDLECGGQFIAHQAMGTWCEVDLITTVDRLNQSKKAMTPTQAESIAAGCLPCRCAGKDQFLNEHHHKDCPAHYRPDVARALVDAAESAIEDAEWRGTRAMALIIADRLDGVAKTIREQTEMDPKADAIISSNKTRVEGEG